MTKLSDFSFNQSINENSKKTDNKKQVSQEDLQEKFDMYKDMSKDQLQNSLFQEVARQKNEGTFDYDGLKRMVDSLQGSISPNEFETIKRLLESLK